MSDKIKFNIYKEIEKLGYATQPLYTGEDGDGNEFAFTVADLVSGKVPYSRVKKWKGRSIASGKKKTKKSKKRKTRGG